MTSLQCMLFLHDKMHACKKEEQTYQQISHLMLRKIRHFVNCVEWLSRQKHNKLEETFTAKSSGSWCIELCTNRTVACTFIVTTVTFIIFMLQMLKKNTCTFWYCLVNIGWNVNIWIHTFFPLISLLKFFRISAIKITGDEHKMINGWLLLLLFAIMAFLFSQYSVSWRMQKNMQFIKNSAYLF